METTSVGRMIWGVALTLMGIGMCFRIPQVMPRISQIPAFSQVTPFLWFCFYFMAILLIGGGVKRIHASLRRGEGPASGESFGESSGESDESRRE